MFISILFIATSENNTDPLHIINKGYYNENCLCKNLHKKITPDKSKQQITSLEEKKISQHHLI